ncbi:MAG: hypothetical protein QOJ52_4269 [Acidimicrobiaceae bacterium]|jgi:hypothetical protein|nr:hypothetical protein [Acidimicrobiaceae bacterium]
MRTIEVNVGGLRDAGFHSPGSWLMLVVAFVILVATANLSQARVLDDRDLEKLSSLKTSFADVMTDLAQASKRFDLSHVDADCLNSAVRELLQLSEELKGYEYLITIETQLSDTGDDDALRHVVGFAVEKALEVLEVERKRLNQVSEQCSRSPFSSVKVQQAVQFVDATAATLKSIQPRL